MKQLWEAIPNFKEIKANALKPQSSRDLALALKDDPQGKQQLAVVLSQFFDTMKLYGKEPEQLRSMAGLFQFALADYEAEKIMQAFAYHLQISSEMPTPADIVNIIRRGNRPPLEKSIYVTISKKQGCDRTRGEWDYMYEYEDFMIHG